MGDGISTQDNLENKLQLPLQYLRDITDNFSPERELGRGGFGVVYKGIDGQSGLVVAVKKLRPILGEQDKQFKNEANHLARLKHNNIVKLIGYCDETKAGLVYDEYQKKYTVAETQEKLLCYEYLSNGSLDNMIFDGSLVLDWEDRYKIIMGICQGLYYLHEGLDHAPIIHMDLKPSNILLDKMMEPKIADFGLSRLFTEEQTRTCTINLMGSIGYMAPEYCLKGEISTKSDIYSLGILILEIVTGKKNHQSIGNNSGEQYIEDVRQNWTEMSQILSMHPSLRADWLQQVHRCIEIGLNCVAADPERRPSASQILLHMLSGECIYNHVYEGMAAKEMVKVSGVPYLPIVMVQVSKKRKYHGAMMVRVEAPPAVKGASLAIDLVAVLDVSSSMDCAAAPPAKTPSRLDLLKKAMKFLIGQLHDNDRLAIVTFSDKLLTECTTGLFKMSSSGRKSAEKNVDGLMAKGNDTACKPSLEHAVKMLDDRVDKTRLGFILLLSDGVDNSEFKWSDKSVIAPKKYSCDILGKYPIHTFGLSQAHDPKALLFIAKESKGTYSSITNNLDNKIIEALAVCLSGLKTTVAMDVYLDFKVRKSWWTYVITRIDSGGYSSHISVDGASGNILIDILCAGEEKEFIIYFDVTMVGEPAVIFSNPTLFADVNYTDIPTRKLISIGTNTLSILISSTPSGLDLEMTVSPIPKVQHQMVIFKLLDFLAEFLKKFEALMRNKGGGGIDKDGADDPVLQIIAGDLLQSKWEEFKKSNEPWIKATRIFVDLRGIDRDVKAMVSSLKRGLGVGCIYSWMWSYTMQRATTTGLPSAAFLTPAMEEMVQEAQKQLAARGKDQDASTYTDNGKEGDPTPTECKRAAELLDVISERLQLWCKMDCEMPPALQPSSENECAESRNLSAAVNEAINRKMHHDIYLVAMHAINEWRSFTGHGSDK